MNRFLDEKKGIQALILGIYAMTMLWLLFFGRLTTIPVRYSEAVPDNVNLLPFATIRLFLNVIRAHPLDFSSALVRASYINLIGNVILFVPLGFCLPVHFPSLRSGVRLFFLSFVLIATVEVLQMLTGLGSCDVDDLLLNMLGTAIGYIRFRIAYFCRSRRL